MWDLTKLWYLFSFLLQEITLDVFLQVSWSDSRLHVPPNKPFIDMPWEFRQLLWTPDLYIWQLQTMRILSVLQEMTSLRLYANRTVSVSIGFVYFFYISSFSDTYTLTNSQISEQPRLS